MTDHTYQLHVQQGPEPGKVYPLTSASMTLGRDPTVEITINDPEVSRQHALLLETPSGFQIQDLGSTNGTLVDGQRLGSEPLLLRSGQVITMGSSVILRYEALASSSEGIETLLDAAGEPEVETLLLSAEATPPGETAEPPPPLKQPPPPPVMPSPSTKSDAPDEQKNGNKRLITLLAALFFLTVCACCSFILFMYYIGGDWLLRQLGLL